uniref:Uncharacterized protein n=1 Tax=Arundo donax TaxID=35708 RepID=A0A0A9FZV4_ARUDO
MNTLDQIVERKLDSFHKKFNRLGCLLRWLSCHIQRIYPHHLSA